MTAAAQYLPIYQAQFGIVSLIKEAIPGVDVSWTGQGTQRDAANLVTIQQLTGPSPGDGVQVSHRRTDELPDDATLTISAATEGAIYWTMINGREVYTAGVLGDTVTTIRDRLLGLLNAEAGVPLVTATSSGADSILLTPTDPGGLWIMRVAGSITVAVGTLDTYAVTDIYRRMTWTIQAYTRDTSPRNSAHELLHRILTALEDPDSLQLVLSSGVSIESKSAVADLTALAGSTWESRASMDLSLRMRGIAIRPISSIDTVSVTLQGREVEGGPIIATDTVEADLT